MKYYLLDDDFSDRGVPARRAFVQTVRYIVRAIAPCTFGSQQLRRVLRREREQRTKDCAETTINQKRAQFLDQDGGLGVNVVVQRSRAGNAGKSQDERLRFGHWATASSVMSLHASHRMRWRFCRWSASSSSSQAPYSCNSRARIVGSMASSCVSISGTLDSASTSSSH